MDFIMVRYNKFPITIVIAIPVYREKQSQLITTYNKKETYNVRLLLIHSFKKNYMLWIVNILMMFIPVSVLME